MCNNIMALDNLVKAIAFLYRTTVPISHYRFSNPQHSYRLRGNWNGFFRVINILDKQTSKRKNSKKETEMESVN